MRIFRTIVLLSAITALMPSLPEEQSGGPAGVGDAGYFVIATNTFSDLASFCQRQPGVCETAGFVAHKLELKAKYGARLIYDWANEANTGPVPAILPDVAQGSDPIKTGSMKLALARQAPPNSQSTLRLDDLIPAWRTPAHIKTS